MFDRFLLNRFSTGDKLLQLLIVDFSPEDTAKGASKENIIHLDIGVEDGVKRDTAGPEIRRRVHEIYEIINLTLDHGFVMALRAPFVHGASFFPSGASFVNRFSLRLS